MRVLSSFLVILFFLIVLGIGSFFVAREALLWWGVNSFKDSLLTLQRSSAGNYSSQCSQKSGGAVVSTPSLQIRFTSDTEYVLEAVCDQFSFTPILIEKKQLTPFITKISGASGVLWGSNRSAVKLTVFEDVVAEMAKFTKMDVSFLTKSRVVGVEDELVVVFADEEAVGNGPVTSCSGYGYQCCRMESEVGQGESILGLPECEKTCFKACASRPVVLAFSSNPFSDPKTRQVSVSSGGTVEFNYVGDAPDANAIQAFIDFCDASKQAQLAGSADKVTHTYTCATDVCTYTAKLRLLDKWDVESFASPLTMIQVLVQAQ